MKQLVIVLACVWVTVSGLAVTHPKPPSLDLSAFDIKNLLDISLPAFVTQTLTTTVIETVSTDATEFTTCVSFTSTCATRRHLTHRTEITPSLHLTTTLANPITNTILENSHEASLSPTIPEVWVGSEAPALDSSLPAPPSVSHIPEETLAMDTELIGTTDTDIVGLLSPSATISASSTPPSAVFTHAPLPPSSSGLLLSSSSSSPILSEAIARTLLSPASSFSAAPPPLPTSFSASSPLPPASFSFPSPLPPSAPSPASFSPSPLPPASFSPLLPSPPSPASPPSPPPSLPLAPRSLQALPPSPPSPPSYPLSPSPSPASLPSPTPPPASLPSPAPAATPAKEEMPQDGDFIIPASAVTLETEGGQRVHRRCFEEGVQARLLTLITTTVTSTVITGTVTQGSPTLTVTYNCVQPVLDPPINTC
ncbi:uncharacterized protein LOC126981113 [Eriocheir sinensis]|uniref:uncharacterized protein LOC126981113 n=1 Tax=Eriocheir sinensis TaxID=95602 RepID=UPI0021CA1506|nr:uncharacterized protein LOC126981113 [Eriocheir sinensis]